MKNYEIAKHKMTKMKSFDRNERFAQSTHKINKKGRESKVGKWLSRQMHITRLSHIERTKSRHKEEERSKNDINK